jgi:hypothetical protein
MGSNISIGKSISTSPENLAIVSNINPTINDFIKKGDLVKIKECIDHTAELLKNHPAFLNFEKELVNFLAKLEKKSTASLLDSFLKIMGLVMSKIDKSHKKLKFLSDDALKEIIEHFKFLLICFLDPDPKGYFGQNRFDNTFEWCEEFKKIWNAVKPARIELLNTEWLLTAVKYGRVDIAKYFVELGLDPKFYNNYCLKLSISKGDIEMIKFLVSCGCDCNYPEENLYYAIEAGNLELVKYFGIRKSEFREIRSQIRCVKLGHLHILKYLAEKGCVIDNFDIIIEAIRTNQQKILRYLIENGINLKYKSDDLLALSISYENYQIAKLLIEQGCTPSNKCLSYFVQNFSLNKTFTLYVFSIATKKEQLLSLNKVESLPCRQILHSRLIVKNLLGENVFLKKILVPTSMAIQLIFV